MRLPPVAVSRRRRTAAVSPEMPPPDGGGGAGSSSVSEESDATPSAPPPKKRRSGQCNRIDGNSQAIEKVNGQYCCVHALQALDGLQRQSFMLTSFYHASLQAAGGRLVWARSLRRGSRTRAALCTRWRGRRRWTTPLRQWPGAPRCRRAPWSGAPRWTGRAPRRPASVPGRPASTRVRDVNTLPCFVAPFQFVVGVRKGEAVNTPRCCDYPCHLPWQ